MGKEEIFNLLKNVGFFISKEELFEVAVDDTNNQIQSFVEKFQKAKNTFCENKSLQKIFNSEFFSAEVKGIDVFYRGKIKFISLFAQKL